jgi:hypothetical protein
VLLRHLPVLHLLPPLPSPTRPLPLPLGDLPALGRPLLLPRTPTCVPRWTTPPSSVHSFFFFASFVSSLLFLCETLTGAESVELRNVDLVVDYSPSHPDIRRLREGDLYQLLNVIPLQNAAFHFPSVKVTNVRLPTVAHPRFLPFLASSHSRIVPVPGRTLYSDISHHKDRCWAGIRSGTGSSSCSCGSSRCGTSTRTPRASVRSRLCGTSPPVRGPAYPTEVFRFSSSRTCAGVSDLFLLPLEAYQKDRSVLHGVARGTDSFARRLLSEALSLSSAVVRKTSQWIGFAAGAIDVSLCYQLESHHHHTHSSAHTTSSSSLLTRSAGRQQSSCVRAALRVPLVDRRGPPVRL